MLYSSHVESALAFLDLSSLTEIGSSMQNSKGGAAALFSKGIFACQFALGHSNEPFESVFRHTGNAQLPHST